jgi:hypothetical protein
MKHPDGIRASANARKNSVGQRAMTLEALGARFPTDHGL